MVPHLLDITLSPAQELGSGLAVTLLVSLNLGIVFNRQGCLFPVPEDMLHLLHGKGRSCSLDYFSSQFFEQIFSPLNSSCVEVWKLVSLCGICSLQMQKHFVHPSVILVLQIVLLPLYLLEMYDWSSFLWGLSCLICSYKLLSTAEKLSWCHLFAWDLWERWNIFQNTCVGDVVIL